MKYVKIIKELHEEIDDLIKVFLEEYLNEVNANSLYINETILDNENLVFKYVSNVRAFYLLTNAAFENAIEDIVRGLIVDSVSKLDEQGEINTILRHFIIGLNPEISNRTIMHSRQSCSNYTDDFDEILKMNVELFFKVINDNHGSKKGNILQLLSYVGLVSKIKDSIFLIELDNWGSNRGTFAHHKYKDAFRLSTGSVEFSNPGDFINKANNIVSLIDTEFVSVVKSVLDISCL